MEIKAMVSGVRQHGSYKRYARSFHRDVLVVRGLAQRGKLRTDDPVLHFLARLGDNGVVWHVLSFWRVARKKIVPEWGYADLGAMDTPAMGPMLTQTEISLNQANFIFDIVFVPRRTSTCSVCCTLAALP